MLKHLEKDREDKYVRYIGWEYDDYIVAKENFINITKEYLANKLSKTDENNPFVCDITLEGIDQGLSSLECPSVTSIYMKDGNPMFVVNNNSWAYSFNEMDMKELLCIVKAIKEYSDEDKA